MIGGRASVAVTLTVLALASARCGDGDGARPPGEAAPLADVVSVRVAGEAGAYRLEVGVRSPDEGCDRYADWWEVVSEHGQLLYRRVLAHSHVGEQPFVRSGGPVPVAADATVWVRAHMQGGGYGGQAFRGSARDGFVAGELAPTFAAGLAEAEPRPTTCTH